ncbi:MAG: peptidase C45, partial [Silvibacterium sp.]
MFARCFRAAVFLSLVFSAVSFAANLKDQRLDGAYRFDRGGWTYVHLQGDPGQIGFQHGYLLAPEIADMFQVLKVESEHSTRRDWQFFRDAGRTVLWPHIDPEYQQELQGIAKGVAARGVNLDLWDIVA